VPVGSGLGSVNTLGERLAISGQLLLKQVVGLVSTAGSRSCSCGTASVSVDYISKHTCIVHFLHAGHIFQSKKAEDIVSKRGVEFV
jgi:hypothetical protein